MIGIFDSGIGGLTVARAIENTMPEASLLYFGDTAKTPYGTKSARVIIEYSLRNGEFLLEKGAKVIVIGCNSASSVAADIMRREFEVPVLEVIGPAAARAVSLSKSGRVGIIGTRATVNSTIYEQRIGALNPSAKVFSVPCPLLVPLVEEGWTTKRETKMILRRYLHPLREQQIDTLILGCTHYPLLKELIQARIGSKVTLIDSSVEAARALRTLLSHTDSGACCRQPAEHAFYLTDITERASRIAAKLFGRPLEFLSP